MSLAIDQPPANAPAPGSIFADKYRIERLLGVGGMGFVMAATHLHLKERVAIKMLRPERVFEKDTVERFLREGRAAVRIRSEHVARILDVGELPDRTPYMVMEYLDGEDLSHLLARRGTLTPSEAVDYVLQACEAIAEAHAMKTVHRDLKPSNLFLARRPNGTSLVKVLDFGISKMMHLNEGDMAMTKTSSMMGSPLYMSPEQLRSSRQVDERADIWALGVILHELISGEPPFLGETIAELGALILAGPTPWLGNTAKDAPADLCMVVATCLKKEARERYANLADFADALAPFGTPAARASADKIIQTLGMPSPSQRAPRLSREMFAETVSSSPNPVTHTLAMTPSGADTGNRGVEITHKTRRSSWGLVVLGASVALIALGAGGAILVKREAIFSKPTAPPASAATAVPTPTPTPTPTPPASTMTIPSTSPSTSMSTSPPKPAFKPQAPVAKASVKAPPATATAPPKQVPTGIATSSKD